MLLLTGPPGVGKTTVIEQTADLLEASGLPFSGFITVEIRDDSGRRQGFRGRSFDGEERVIAHVDLPGPPRVGKYGVDVAAIDALSAGVRHPGARVVLLDEIGKMECFSERFVAAVKDLLEGSVPAVASVARRGPELIRRVREHPETTLWEVSRANRAALPQEVVGWVRERTG